MATQPQHLTAVLLAVDNQLARRQYEEQQLQQRVERAAEMRKEQTLAKAFTSKCKLEDSVEMPKRRRPEVRVRAGFGAYTPPHKKSPQLGLALALDNTAGASPDEMPAPAEMESGGYNHERPMPTENASMGCSQQRREKRVRPGFCVYVPPAQRSEKTPT